MRLATSVGGVSLQCEVRRSLDAGPHVSFAGAITAFMSNEKLQVDLSFPVNIFALRAMDLSSEYSLSIPIRSKNAREVWGIFRNSRTGVTGQPQSIQIDEFGERRTEVRADVPRGRRIKLEPQGVVRAARVSSV